MSIGHEVSVIKQMYINSISGGILDGSSISDLEITGQVYDLTENETVIITLGDKEYPAAVSGSRFSVVIPAAELINIPNGQYVVSAKTTVMTTTILEVTNATPPDVTLTASQYYFSNAELTAGLVIAQYSTVDGDGASITYSLAGEHASYFSLDDGDVLFTAAGVTAVNSESMALSRLTLSLNCTDGVRTVNTSIAFEITDPLILVEPTPTKPAQLIGDWDLTFQDEFTAPDIRDEHWVLKKGTAGMGYNSLDSVYVEDNKAVLMTQIDTKAHDCEYEHYAGCEITTFDKFAQQYGYFECRAKYEAKRGAWPAFWLMPDTGSRGTVPQDAKVLFSFDLSSISEPITSAELKFGLTSATMFNNNLQEDEEVTATSIQVYPFKSWTPENLKYEDIKQIPFRFLGYFETLVAGDVATCDLTADVNKSINNKYHCMLADNYRSTVRMSIAGSTNEDESMRPVLIINGGTVLTPSQEGSFRSGYSQYGSPEEFTTGVEEYNLYDSWANASSTSGTGMEVDIFETLGVWGEEVNAIALHWDGYGSSHKGAGSGHIDITPSEDGYHTYGCLWDEDGLTFYIDNNQVWQRSFTPDEDVDNIRAFTDPAYILLSQQTGGWDGNNEQIDRDNFPAKVWFDFVRVWKKVEEGA
jgi:hypothetical protein